jgi:hypothetical protein
MRFFLACAFAQLLLACSCLNNGNIQEADRVNVDAMELTACVADTDCDIVPKECCPCNHGGKVIAVAKNMRQHTKFESGACKDRVCPMFISKDPSCKASGVKCVAGKCQLSY